MCGIGHALTTARLHGKARNERAVNGFENDPEMSSVHRTSYYLIRIAHFGPNYFCRSLEGRPRSPVITESECRSTINDSVIDHAAA